jgi:glutamine amidotransferase-like uncharacterized protein
MSLWLLAGVLSCSATACGKAESTSSVPSAPTILLFTGSGTSPGDVAAFERLLTANRFTYSTATSSRLDAMSESELRIYRLLIVPGGNFETIGNGLTQSTPKHLRDAVHGGLNYLGICAGAFFAGNSPFNGLNLTSGVRFAFYSAEERGIRKAAVHISSADMPALDQYWEDGPQLTGWGDVVAKYPDGTPAVVQGSFGEGRVVLAGVHPEAPESWRRGMIFATPASVDNAYAVTLIDAAMNRKALPRY